MLRVEILKLPRTILTRNPKRQRNEDHPELRRGDQHALSEVEACEADLIHDYMMTNKNVSNRS
jgi:hypothetical protein